MSRARVYARKPLVEDEVEDEIARVKLELVRMKREVLARQERAERYKREIKEMEARRSGEKVEELRREREKLLAERAALADRLREAMATQEGKIAGVEFEQHRELFTAMYMAVDKTKREYERLRKSKAGN